VVLTPDSAMPDRPQLGKSDGSDELVVAVQHLWTAIDLIRSDLKKIAAPR
jgi:hypothetical protein